MVDALVVLLVVVAVVFLARAAWLGHQVRRRTEAAVKSARAAAVELVEVLDSPPFVVPVICRS